MSRFTLANETAGEVREAFRNRPHLVDHAPGFIRMEVYNPVDQPEEFLLLTYWRDEDAYRRWHRSHAYHDSHAGMPKGLKLVPGTVKIQVLRRVAE